MRLRTGRAAALAAVPALLGGLLLAAGPASAATFADTSLQASPPVSTASVAATVTGSGYLIGCQGLSGPVSLTAASSNPAGQPVLYQPSGGITCGSDLTTASNGGVNSGPYADGNQAFTVSASPNPGHNATESAVLHFVVSGGSIAQIWTESVTLTTPPNTVYPDVKFSGTDTRTCVGYGLDLADSPCGATTPIVSGIQTESSPLGGSFLSLANGPAGLMVSGNAIAAAGSTAVPGTYSYTTVQGSQGGAAASETFTLTVTGHPVFTSGNFGNYVNPYGNGFDIFRQHYAVNALVAGWTATKGDPATHFVRIVNVHGGYSIEAVNAKNIATGLCVSDPVGSEPPGFAAGQLTLRGCNGSVFQGFSQPGGNGTALDSDIAGAGHVEPNGTGAPLTVRTAFDPWGGFRYTWTDFAHLPG